MSNQVPPGARGPGGGNVPLSVPYPKSAPYREPVSNTKALWAICLAAVPVPVGWLISVGLAISVLSESRDGRGKERGALMAKLALLIVPVWVLLVVAAFAIPNMMEADRDAAGAVTARGDTLTSSLRSGDCLTKLPPIDKIRLTVEVVPCSEDHAAEVFAVFDIPDGAYPGDAEVTRLSEGGCVKRYARDHSMRAALQQDLVYFPPTRLSWSSDRRVMCIAVAVVEKPA